MFYKFILLSVIMIFITKIEADYSSLNDDSELEDSYHRYPSSIKRGLRLMRLGKRNMNDEFQFRDLKKRGLRLMRLG
uniref:Secreted peptide prohormone 4 n=1 Tax=Schmidtea mediterranea TaxID=79327 RepID=E3T7U1_SCHMD|nr:secreted peptide prohormone 4 [Schmidtea mediterranea]